MDLKEEAILGDRAASHWYYVSKTRAVRRLLRGVTAEELLDVGAGSGVFSRDLLRAGLVRRATCVDPGYAPERLDRIERIEREPGAAAVSGSGQASGQRVAAAHAAGELVFRREIEDAPQDLVLMMDVLEHVDDDAALLRQHADPLKPGSHVLVSVPAFQWLWSGHDVFLEHRRRYTLGEVETLVERCGLEVVRGRYFFGLLLPAAAASRWIDRLRTGVGGAEPRSAVKATPHVLNELLVAIHDVERALVLPWNRLAGLTAFCLARK